MANLLDVGNGATVERRELEAWSAALGAVKAEDKTAVANERLLRWIWEAAGHSGQPFKDFARRALWGNAAAKLCQQALTSRQPSKLAEMISGGRAADLATAGAGLRRRIDASALQRVLALVDSGQSVVLATTHAGSLHALRHAVYALPAVVIGVGNGKGQGGATLETRQHMSTTENVELQFLKLIKLIRKEPRIVFIAVDGRVGSEHIEVDLFGRSVPFSPGAGFMARQGRAPLVFTRTRWDGEGLVIDVDDPVSLSVEAVGDDWREAYGNLLKQNLEKALAGPPEDMRLIAGLWGKLKTSLKEDRETLR